ncbi:DUF2150 family protein [Archaeoglobus veneficus]|uniref:Uncharacterized conserved protein UCP022079 n=1 Tax=Archaeoglobus veneficus (strain DSM 11195 / SNP6) TaxID=693661 RepID=F2KRY5_ARCVS|nr:DUF2150 family protein [Archaeoglobus veneficus]AEA46826.1 Uncharacterized conserved protein UCP022079 [Archaeoglobus veneficus SNP6]
MNYYSETRFNNWVNKIREANIDLDNAESLAVFDQMMEDLVVACLNVIRAVKERELTKKEAIQELNAMEQILMSDVSFDDTLKSDFFDFVREGLRVVVNAAKYCVEGKISKKNFNTLIKEAVEKEKKGDFEGAFDTIARMGAKVFKGEKLPEDIDVPEEGMVLNWIDGVDAINTVMLLIEIDASTESDE